MSPMSRGTVGALAPVMTAAVVLALTAGPARADMAHDVPDAAVVTITGDGSGHGRGLSQYGAYSAARKGVGHRTVLGFYYPHTRWKRLGGSIEVLVSQDDDGDTVVRDAPRLRVREIGTGRSVVADEPEATRWRVTDGEAGTSEVSWFDGSWHPWRSFRPEVAFSAGDRELTLVTPEGDVRYRGSLRSAPDDRGTRVSVNDVPLEQYVRGVVPSEMQAGWPQQALRAQAVASRTYGAWRRAHPLDVAYDICDSPACQVYGGASAEARSTTRAAQKTAQRVLTYRRKPIFAEFSASNGGHTVDGGKRYLPARRDRYEGTSPDYYGWKITIRSGQLEEQYHLENVTRIQVVRRDATGRVAQLDVDTEGGDAPGTYSLDVESFRRNFALPSTLFRVTRVR